MHVLRNFLFFIGLKIEIKSFMQPSSQAVSVAIISAAVPFLLGFFVMSLMGYPVLTAIIIGMCLSVTAEAVTISVLEELNLLKTKIGKIVVNAGILDDLFELMFIGVIGAIATATDNLTTEIFKMIGDILIFVMLVYAVRFFFIPLIIL